MSDKKEKSQSNIQKIESGVKPFSDTTPLSFIKVKLEKISSAVYLVTNHLHDSEPIKWETRNVVLAVLKDISRSNIINQAGEFKVENVIAGIESLMSELSILKNAGLISASNESIITHELGAIGEQLLDHFRNSHAENSSFAEDFFSVSQRENDNIGRQTWDHRGTRPLLGLGGADEGEYEKSSIKDIYKGHIKDTQNMTFTNQVSPQTQASQRQKKSAQKRAGSERKELIIGLIRDRGEVSIKDISKVIKDCSEKTLQRDLVRLVKAGVLEKEGERRWSKYSLR